MNNVNITYSRNGSSTIVNELGMREMQRRAYQKRYSKYLLLKAPPASGKSRALMFIALDKLNNQHIRKVVVAVPDRSIGASFRKTDLKSNGFFYNWNPDLDLTSEGDTLTSGKVRTFVDFLENKTQRILICTHAALRFAFDQIDAEKFNDTLLVIDEFHHVSADRDSSKLGNLIHDLMENSTAHIVAMTGSYFRGDGVPVLMPEDEAKFLKVTFSYYDQLNGYTYLKTLGIGFHFYKGKYTSAIKEVLDTDKKTLIHIPSVQSRESTGNKYEELDIILDIIGDEIGRDPGTGVITVRRREDGRHLKIADLVEDDPQKRDKIVRYLRSMKSIDDIDIIIALGMAKEGFDWPWCESALTVGYRGSLTEIVQIIGRCTRDSENKTHAQFTNLIAQPDAEDAEVTNAVNDMLKAITCSLLMEQVMAPNFSFAARLGEDNGGLEPGQIGIRGLKPLTGKVKEILETDLDDLTARTLQDTDIQKAIAADLPAEQINRVLIPRLLKKAYPHLDSDDLETLRQHFVSALVLKSSTAESGTGPLINIGEEISEPDPEGLENPELSADRRIIQLAGQFINIDDLTIDLIESINPFQRAYEIISKQFDKQTFKLIQDCIASLRIEMDVETARQLWPKVQMFQKRENRAPDIHAEDPEEQELAQAVVVIRNLRRKMGI